MDDLDVLRQVGAEPDDLLGDIARSARMATSRIRSLGSTVTPCSCTSAWTRSVSRFWYDCDDPGARSAIRPS